MYRFIDKAAAAYAIFLPTPPGKRSINIQPKYIKIRGNTQSRWKQVHYSIIAPTRLAILQADAEPAVGCFLRTNSFRLFSMNGSKLSCRTGISADIRIVQFRKQRYSIICLWQIICRPVLCFMSEIFPRSLFFVVVVRVFCEKRPRHISVLHPSLWFRRGRPISTAFPSSASISRAAVSKRRMLGPSRWVCDVAVSLQQSSAEHNIVRRPVIPTAAIPLVPTDSPRILFLILVEEIASFILFFN